MQADLTVTRRWKGKVRIWNPSGDLISELHTDLNSIFGLAISPDHRLVCIGGGGAVFGKSWEYTGGIEVWSLEKKVRVARFGEDELFFTKSISFSPDGRQLLTSTFGKPSKEIRRRKRLAVWNTSSFTKLSAFGEHFSGIETACFFSAARFVAFAANPVDVSTQRPSGILAALRRTGFPFRAPRNAVQLHDVGSMISVIRIWDTVSQRELQSSEMSIGRIEKIAVSPDGRRLVSCGSKLLIWDLERLRILTEFPQGPNSYSLCVAFSPDGRIVASGGGFRSGVGSPYEDCGVRLWDSETARLIAFLPHGTPVHSLAFSPDGQKIVAGGELGELLLWNIVSFSEGAPQTWEGGKA